MLLALKNQTNKHRLLISKKIIKDKNNCKILFYLKLKKGEEDGN